MVPACEYYHEPQDHHNHGPTGKIKMAEFLDYITDAQGNQEYRVDGDGNQVYRTTTNLMELFAKRGGEPYYAKDKNQKEIYPVISGKQRTIPDATPDKYYAKDEHDNQYYPKDRSDFEQPYIDATSGKVTYARTNYGEEFYPKSALGFEIVNRDQYITNKDGTLKYTLDVNGDPVYPQHSSGNEYYMLFNGKLQLAKNKSGVPVYAKRKTSSGEMEEFYPPDGQIAYLLTGEPIYAEKSTGELIFPTDAAKNEFYLKNRITQADAVYSAGKMLHRYARDNQGNEFYPKDKREVVLDNRYAKLKSTQVIYPLDENGNEYMMYDDKKSDKDNFPLGYPITNDTFVIVPKIDGRPYISKNLFPKVTLSSINGMIYRDGEGYTDYVTTRRAGRPSRSTKTPRYKVLPVPLPPQQNLIPQPPAQPAPVQPAPQLPPAQPAPQLPPGNIPVKPAIRHPVANSLTTPSYMTISISVAVVFGVIAMILLMRTK